MVFTIESFSESSVTMYINLKEKEHLTLFKKRKRYSVIFVACIYQADKTTQTTLYCIQSCSVM